MYEPLTILEVFRMITKKEVPNVQDGRYEVSNYGRVFDYKNNRFLSITNSTIGYKTVSLALDQKPKRVMVTTHSLVAKLFVNGYEEGKEVNHKDGDKSNPFFMNLEWVTHRENLQHAYDTGLHSIGEDNPTSVLTNKQVMDICKALDEKKLTYKEIVEELNLPLKSPYPIISLIYHGKLWRHIAKDYNFFKDKNENKYFPINRD